MGFIKKQVMGGMECGPSLNYRCMMPFNFSAGCILLYCASGAF